MLQNTKYKKQMNVWQMFDSNESYQKLSISCGLKQIL